MLPLLYCTRGARGLAAFALVPLLLLALLLLALCPPTRAWADAAPEAKAAQVVLARYCARCHGGHLRRPKGEFGFILDLRRLRASSAYILPGRPEASPLWRDVAGGKMPPPDSDAERPGPADIAVLRTWIAAGASAEGIEPPRGPGPGVAPSVHTLPRRLGQFHPLVVHFPVALLIAAALAELIAWRRGSRIYAACGRYCLLLGTAGAWVAGGTGWLWARSQGYTATSHRWLGIATCLLALATCLFMRAPGATSTGTRARLAYRLALLASLLLVAMAGYFGGRITYGPDYHAW